MKFSALPYLVAASAVVGSVQADVITMFDFTDAHWNITVTEFLNPIDAGSGVTLGGAGLLADRTGTSGGSIYVVATLNGAISTAGYQNVALDFISDGSSQTSWDANTSFGSTTGDGFRIESTQGIDFDTTGAGFVFESLLDGFAQTWTPALAAAQIPGPQDLEFSSSVDNSAITDLTFQLQVNGTNDFIRLRNFALTGDLFVPVAHTPEPGSFAVLLLGTLGIGWRIRRRSLPTA